MIFSGMIPRRSRERSQTKVMEWVPSFFSMS